MHIPFAVSERSTIGIEWELALVDSDSGDLRQVAMTVLDAVRPVVIVNATAFALGADGAGDPLARVDAPLPTLPVR